MGVPFCADQRFSGADGGHQWEGEGQASLSTKSEVNNYNCPAMQSGRLVNPPVTSKVPGFLSHGARCREVYYTSPAFHCRLLLVSIRAEIKD